MAIYNLNQNADFSSVANLYSRPTQNNYQPNTNYNGGAVYKAPAPQKSCGCGHVAQAYTQPIRNAYNKYIGQPMQQFAQKHPVATGLASGAAAGMGMAAMTSCPYAGATAGAAAAAPYMGQIAQGGKDLMGSIIGQLQKILGGSNVQNNNNYQHTVNGQTNTWNNNFNVSPY